MKKLLFILLIGVIGLSSCGSDKIDPSIKEKNTIPVQLNNVLIQLATDSIKTDTIINVDYYDYVIKDDVLVAKYDVENVAPDIIWLIVLCILFGVFIGFMAFYDL